MKDGNASGDVKGIKNDIRRPWPLVAERESLPSPHSQSRATRIALLTLTALFPRSPGHPVPLWWSRLIPNASRWLVWVPQIPMLSYDFCAVRK